MPRHRLLAVCVVLLPAICTSFVSKHPSIASRKQQQDRSLCAGSPQEDSLDNDSYCVPKPTLDTLASEGIEEKFPRRRSVLASLVGTTLISPFYSEAIEEETIAEPNLDCLLDLPPIPKDCVRIFLCRHGQTENNRLRRVQGSRVNPPINANGEAMAQRLGMALERLGSECPSVVMHSDLLRAEQTAQIASQEMKNDKIRLELLTSLREVDFGPMTEGKKLAEVRPLMVQTYAQWSAGLVDSRPEGGGDSGRDVLNRAVAAINTLVNIASESETSSVMAVSHSTYLRMLIAVLSDMPLATATSIVQANCCINVIDFNKFGKTRTLGPKCKLLGGPLSQAPDDFEITLPANNVLRINEKRHLEGLI